MTSTFYGLWAFHLVPEMTKLVIPKIPIYVIMLNLIIDWKPRLATQDN